MWTSAFRGVRPSGFSSIPKRKNKGSIVHSGSPRVTHGWPTTKGCAISSEGQYHICPLLCEWHSCRGTWKVVVERERKRKRWWWFAQPKNATSPQHEIRRTNFGSFDNQILLSVLTVNLKKKKFPNEFLLQKVTKKIALYIIILMRIVSGKKNSIKTIFFCKK